MAKIYLNDDWKFVEEFDEKLLFADIVGGELETVRIPHTCRELPFHYFDEAEYQMISGYRKELDIPKEYEGKNLLLTFEGVAHECNVYLNGKEIAKHSCGYTAFSIDISKLVNYSRKNILVVRVNSREDINVPPFGFVIDYMTYGGIYRDVYLEVKEAEHICDVFAYSEITEFIMKPEGKRFGVATLGARIQVSDAALIAKESAIPVPTGCSVLDITEGCNVRVSIRKVGEEKYLPVGQCDVTEKTVTIEKKLLEVELWDVENPVLYEIKTDICRGDICRDTVMTTFGFRKAQFEKDGFYLNNRKFKIRGLNRHQSYAYTGYAMPESMQRLDADILKNELSANAVRTSHYPQSHYFVDQCDKIGLLVFTEIPGWQHIGDAEWKNQAVENVREMITQYRNHPSIILWGVRINESVDDDEFYKRTNELAHDLDPYRQTGGVRCIKNSQLYEDVYTYNDFIHDGISPGCSKKAKVTSDVEKPYMVTEYNGHMFPTKSYDAEEHRVEHAMRHVRVLDAVAGESDIAGSFAWCMFDYNTHKDFGSGDRICYHGVMDMFRNPKMAAAVYATQGDGKPYLELSSSMDIGERPATVRGIIYAFTNADKLRMYKNDRFIKEYDCKDTPYKNMPHGPIVIDDFVGDVLEKVEGFKPAQAGMIKSILNDVGRYGMNHPPKSVFVNAAKLMALYHMKFDDVSALYTKYIGDWGGEATVYKFEAIKDGEVVKTLIKAPTKKHSIITEVSSTKLVEDKSYDMALVRIRAVDEWGNVLPFYNDPVSLEATGDVEIVGPKVIALSGGMGGCYVKTKGHAGVGKLIVRTNDCGEETISFTVSKK